MAASLLARKARLQAIGTLINAAGGGAIHLYAGTMPASPENAPASAPLAIIDLPSNCGTVGEAGTLATFTFAPVVGNAASSGQVVWARYVDGAGVAIYDETAGLPGSGAAVVFTDNKTPASTQIFAGGEIQIASSVLSE